MASASLNQLLQSVLPLQNLTNVSGNPTGHERSQIFETIIPGFKPIHNFILTTFGIDITILVTFFVALWAMIKVGKYIWVSVDGFVSDYLKSTIMVTSHDDIHEHLIKWLSVQPSFIASRSLLAETDIKSAWDVEEDDSGKTTASDSAAIGFLNFSNEGAENPPRFSPAVGNHRFWHNGTFFMLRRTLSTSVESSGGLALSEKENLYLSCFGRSPAPIKSLLQDAKDFFHVDHDAKTVIRRPANKDFRRYGARHCWTTAATRPCRPLETVVLEARRKAEVLTDVNEYLRPGTARWYACRGIPYRRGYLFHGPPGTGKTSLSFALAGVFGLDIYVISLLESTLTEEDLSYLFNALPRRCVVLLEDIDTAGLRRMPDEPAEEAARAASPSTSEASQAEGWQKVSTDIAKAFKKASHTAKEDEKKGISLSGLLNAIDGVSSQEGRVLVMTTNKPESLDSALTRPGRVDLQVAFSNASTSQVKELFERMYVPDPPKSRRSKALGGPQVNKDPNSATSSPLSATNKIAAKDTMIAAAHGYPARSLKDCAEEFTSHIRDGALSPAEVQGFLLKRKKDPQRACKEVAKWAESVVGIREFGGKVLDVQ